jgi:hypothetical protein
MLDTNRVWRFFVPVALIVLVLTTTMGMVWHHHDGYSGDQCRLCHLALSPAVANADACEVVPAIQYFPVKEDCFVSRCKADEKPPRAPPV